MTRIIPKLSEEEKVLLVIAARHLLIANPKRPGRAVAFRHQGRTLKGMDCIGVLVYVFTQLGYEVSDRIDYGILPAKRKLFLTLQDHLGPPVTGPLQVGDIPTMAWGGEECHVGIVTDHPEGLGLLHSYKSSGMVIEHGLTENETKLIEAVFRP